ncbi:MAG TPA: hypothetical protein VK761_00350 [Solirubrobacteraceae bacterium]|jgi:hypothetical protein|nr:hypothetical protein [Solirubrobacteraceae bacterium]
MPDFDANEDSLRLSGAGRDDSLDQPKLRPRFSPRSRELASRECRAGASRAPERIVTALAGQRRGAARHACSRGERVLLLAGPPRRRRRLWTTCHGHASGSPS